MHALFYASQKMKGFGNLHVRFLDSLRKFLEYFLVIKTVAVIVITTAQATATNTTETKTRLFILVP